MASPHTSAARARRFGPVLSSERTEQVRTAAETMAVGALFLVFSLPLVTVGAAWCAAAEVVAGWHDDREAPLLRTFASVVRRDLRGGAALLGVVLAVAAATWLEVHAVLGSRIPGR
ncbi:MAG: YesL family protein, partial [Streptomyces sp.]|nr:YesL family protein [Streptomyces sp.]